ncbi:MAG: hypothetical protein CUN57_01050 [Phototrophicales bacterium]|nr:MAG: hypothetical protein CUN57_01050 [Phototrophicales bacterium]
MYVQKGKTMYAQVTNLSVPIGQIEALRDLVQNKYLAAVQKRDGFIRAYLMEAIDDEQVAQLITYWDSQQAIEEARKTGSLQETVQVLASHMPGVKIQRQGYIVTVDTKSENVSV